MSNDYQNQVEENDTKHSYQDSNKVCFQQIIRPFYYKVLDEHITKNLFTICTSLFHPYGIIKTINKVLSSNCTLCTFQNIHHVRYGIHYVRYGIYLYGT